MAELNRSACCAPRPAPFSRAATARAWTRSRAAPASPSRPSTIISQQGRAVQGSRARARQARADRARGRPQDLRESLLRFALAYRKRALGAQGIATFRTLVPEVPRFRALARGDVRQQRRRAGASAWPSTSRKAWTPADCGATTRASPPRCFLSMLAGHDRLKRLFAREPTPRSEARAPRASSICFLRAYSMKCPSFSCCAVLAACSPGAKRAKDAGKEAAAPRRRAAR